MPEIDNQQTRDDLQELRDELPNPEDRDFGLRARGYSHIRVLYDDPTSGMEHDDLREMLRERGYTFSGLNFMSMFTVWTREDDA